MYRVGMIKQRDITNNEMVVNLRVDANNLTQTRNKIRDLSDAINNVCNAGVIMRQWGREEVDPNWLSNSNDDALYGKLCIQMEDTDGNPTEIELLQPDLANIDFVEGDIVDLTQSPILEMVQELEANFLHPFSGLSITVESIVFAGDI